MPQRHLLYILCFLFIQLTYSQNKYDRINELLSHSQKALDSANYNHALTWAHKANNEYSSNEMDTTKINIHEQIALIHVLKGSIDSSLYYCETAIKKSTKAAKSSKSYFAILGRTADTYMRKRLFPEAIDYLNQSIQLQQSLLSKKTPGIARQYISIGMCYMALRQFNKADDNFKQAQTILTKNKSALNYTLLLYSRMGYNYALMRKFDLAKEYAELEINLAKKLHGSQSIAVSSGYLKLGSLYAQSKQLEKALLCFKLYEEIYINLGLENSGELGLIYFNTGNLYYQLHQFSRGIIYLNKSLSILKNDKGGKYSFRLSKVYILLGKSYLSLEKKEKALEYFNKAKSTFIKPIIHGFSKMDIEVAIAQCLPPLKEEKKIVKTMEEAIQFYTQNNISHNIDVPYHYLANMYFEQKQYEKSIEYHFRNLEHAKSYSRLSSQIHSNIAIAHNYCFLKDFIKAEQHLNHASQLLNYNNGEKPDNFEEVIYKNKLLFYIRTKTLLFTKKQAVTNNPIYLDSIHLNNQLFLNCQEYLDHQYSTLTDKSIRLYSQLENYDQCIKFYIDQHKTQDLENAFEIAEKTKSRLLKINLNAVNATRFNNVPDSILIKDRELKKSISKYEKLKFESKNDSILNDCTDKLFLLKRKKDKLYDLILTQYPKFHNLKYNHKVIDVSSIQQQLDINQTLIEYFIGDNNIYLFTITKNKYKVKSIEIPQDFDQWVIQLRNSIYNYDDEKQTNQYLASAHLLYNTLIKPIKKELKQKLIIIPDGVLNYIPFETLLEKKVDQITSYKDLPYLIKNHQISYNYSATLYHELLTQKSKAAKENLLAFAPSFKDNKEKFKNITARRNSFENLLYNIPEAEMAHEYISGSLFKGNEATENNFLKNAEDYKIIHLSTHAKSNDKLGDYSFIAMSNVNDSIDDANRIYTSELYNLNLKADMVVLSACETGLGELQKGEGIISLARAFTYAGAKSTINSLWSVNDASTKTLMEEFYKNIKAGKTKDQALHEAKLSYLENEDMDAPYFWASFIAMGNMEPIALSSGFNYWWLLIIPVLFGILFFAKRKR